MKHALTLTLATAALAGLAACAQVGGGSVVPSSDAARAPMTLSAIPIATPDPTPSPAPTPKPHKGH